MPREIVLVGGGHSHIEVIRRLTEEPLPDAALTVVDPKARVVYSGMVPGFVAGQYGRGELEIHLRALCEKANAKFIEATAIRVDEDAVVLSDGSQLAFDVASLDIGSSVAGMENPGVREFSLPSRPISAFVSGLGKLLEASSDGAFHIVGGGAGGIELAFCLEARLGASGRLQPRVSLVTRDASVLVDGPPRLRAIVERTLERRAIAVTTGVAVAAVRNGVLELADGARLRTAGTLWVAGPAAHALGNDSGLPVDDRGFIRIDPTLRVSGKRNLFAVGDCASMPGMRRAGVYAVRSGPVLDRNIRALFRAEPLRGYEPQGDFLSLLNLGDGAAIGSKWGLATSGRWVMRLKDRIDRSFMEKYR